MVVPAGVWIISALVVAVISYIAFWTLNKAYSRKWEEPEEIPQNEEQK